MPRARPILAPSLVALGVVSALAGLACVQQATPPESAQDRHARVHFQSATEHFDAGDYEAAAREFLAAYELSRRPQLLFNLYLAYERLGEVGVAADYLERYLADVPDATVRSTLDTRLRTRCVHGSREKPMRHRCGRRRRATGARMQAQARIVSSGQKRLVRRARTG